MSPEPVPESPNPVMEMFAAVGESIGEVAGGIVKANLEALAAEYERAAAAHLGGDSDPYARGLREGYRNAAATARAWAAPSLGSPADSAPPAGALVRHAIRPRSEAVEVRFRVPDGWAANPDAGVGTMRYTTPAGPEPWDGVLVAYAEECDAPPDWTPGELARYLAGQHPGGFDVRRLADGTWLAHAAERDPSGRAVHHWTRLHVGPSRHILFLWMLVCHQAGVAEWLGAELERAEVTAG